MHIKTTGMAPLIQVFDMKTSVAFYCDKLGFKLLQRSQEGEDHFDWCMLENGGTYLMLNTRYERHERPPAPDPKRIEAHDDIGFYFRCDDAKAAHRALQAKGLNVAPPQKMHYGALEFAVTDPDGFNIFFQQFD
jgi:glyoxylase I family protein